MRRKVLDLMNTTLLDKNESRFRANIQYNIHVAVIYLTSRTMLQQEVMLIKMFLLF